jgi:hypothetical protein
MNRHGSSRPHRESRGPSIELIDDEPMAVQSTPVARSSGRRRGAAHISVAPPPPEGRARLRAGVALAVALGAAVSGVVYVNGRSPAGQGGPATGGAVPQGERMERPSTAAPELQPPSEAELAALETGATGELADALRVLQQRAVTPQGLLAVEAASHRTTDVELLRRVTCYRVRGGAPLDVAFSALPAMPVSGAEWAGDGAACLVEAIAARASEMPERSLAVLADRALAQDTEAIVAGLSQLDPEQLPPSVAAALDGGTDGRTQRAAIRVAIALGAAAKWPERVTSWLEHPDRVIRLHAHAELLRQHDDDSQRLAAQATAADPADEELTRRAVEEMGKGYGFDGLLAAVAADPSAPAAARVHAADLVGLHGGEAACRVVAAIASEPALASILAETRVRIDQRFASSPKTLARR